MRPSRTGDIAVTGDILRAFQNASSRLTLVLWPAITIERLTAGDFIGGLRFDPVVVECFALALSLPQIEIVRLWRRRERAGFRRRGSPCRGGALRAVLRLTIQPSQNSACSGKPGIGRSGLDRLESAPRSVTMDSPIPDTPCRPQCGECKHAWVIAETWKELERIGSVDEA